MAPSSQHERGSIGALVPHHRLLAEVAQATAGRSRAATALSRNNHHLPSRHLVNNVCKTRITRAPSGTL